MRARMRAFLFVAVMMVIGGFAFAQTVNHDIDINIVNVAMLAVDDGGGVEIHTTNPATAGGVVAGSTDTVRVDYTSLASAARVITASITSGTVPAGTAVQIEATGVIPANCGTALPALTLTGADQDVINTFQSCNTGVGTGPDLTYTLIITDATALVAGASSTIQVTLTLQDD